MSVWVWSAQMAVLLGAVVFLVLFGPIVAWQFRRYGRLSFLRLMGAAAVSLYGVALATYTWLPLPSNEFCAAHPGRALQLMPFSFLGDIARETAGMSMAARAASFPVLQVAFNIVLFLPLGIAVRRFFHRSLAQVLFWGFAVSAFIEVTQYTGLWFIYSCSYRLADIDDILLNTLGALIGGLIAPLLLGWMPSSSDLAADRLVARPVTTWRRWLGMLVDGSVLFFGQGALQIMVTAGFLVAGLDVNGSVRAWISGSTLVLVWLFVFIAPALRRGGSLGQHVVWLEPRWRGRDGALGPGRWWQRILRSSVVTLPYVVNAVLDLDGSWAGLLGASAGIWLLVDIVMVPLTKDHGGLSARLTGATMSDARE